MFDPYIHADTLGIRICWMPGLPARGYWASSHNTIYLREGLGRVQERCTLAHELGHAALGHRLSTPRNEAAADRWAATRLICPHALARAAAATGDHAQWCRDLDVTPRILITYTRHMEHRLGEHHKV